MMLLSRSLLPDSNLNLFKMPWSKFTKKQPSIQMRSQDVPAYIRKRQDRQRVANARGRNSTIDLADYETEEFDEDMQQHAAYGLYDGVREKGRPARGQLAEALNDEETLPPSTLPGKPVISVLPAVEEQELVHDRVSGPWSHGRQLNGTRPIRYPCIFASQR